VKKTFQPLYSYKTILLLQSPSWSGCSSEVRAKVGRAPVGWEQEWVGHWWDISGNLAESRWGSWLAGHGKLFGQVGGAPDGPIPENWLGEWVELLLGKLAGK